MYPFYYPGPGQLIRGPAMKQDERFFPFILPFAAGLLAGPLLVRAFSPAFAPPYPPYAPPPPGMPYPPAGYPGQGPAYNIYPNQGGFMAPAVPIGGNQQQGITENIYIYK